VTRWVKHISDNAACREVVNNVIRKLADRYAVVIDGRDIGTKVFPDASYKFYLDARPMVRATRRALELGLPTNGTTFDTLMADIQRRDSEDMARTIAPLRRADDAIFLDTSDLSIEAVIGLILDEMRDAGFEL
jgi:CMP/dCMP kinase